MNEVDATPKPGPAERRATGRWPVALLCGLLVLPGGGSFSGLPLSHGAEFACGVLLWPLLWQGSLRRQLGRRLARRPRLARGLAAAALLAAVLKLVSLGVGDGVAACYRTPLAEPNQGAGCEFSFENPFGFSGATRVDRALDFGPGDWNLAFFNSLRFNFWERPGDHPPRDRLPFQVRWTGTLQAPGAERIEIEYSGQGLLTLGEARGTLDATYGSTRRVSWPLPAGPQPLTLDYSFDDGARAGQPTEGPYATFRLQARDRSGQALPTRLGPVGAWATAGRAAAAAADVLVAGFGLALLAFHLWRPWRDLAPWLLVAVVALLAPAFHDSDLAIDVGPSLLASVATLLLVLCRRKARDVPMAWFAAVALALLTLSPSYPSLRSVELRNPGDDWIAYESFARSILEERSLAGGEPVFFYQPLFRYWRFGERLLLGDGDLLVAVGALAALNTAILLGLRRMTARRGAARGITAAVGVSLLCMSHAATGGLRFVMLGASEYPAWILAPFVLSSLFVSRTARAPLRGAALIGLSALTRLNHVPALIALFAAFVARHWRRPRRLAGPTAILVGLLLLPLAHNVYYGRSPEPLTATRTRAQSLVLPPDHALANARNQETLVRQVRYSLLLFRPSWDWGLLWVAVRGLQLLYLGTVGGLLVTRRLGPAAVLVAASPLLSLAVHFFYVVNNYYPRHILAGHLLMGFCTALLASGALNAGRDRRGGGRPEAAQISELKRNWPLALASTAACFLVVEVALRVLESPSLYIRSENPRLIFELNPAYRDVNALGMRQGEVDRARLGRDFVVAAIGDSHTYSVSSGRPEHTYPARLEVHLRGLTGEAVTVLNFGVPGYNMAQELEVLKARALPLEPDYVILQYCINDEHFTNYAWPEHAWLNRLAHASTLLARIWTGLLYPPGGPGRLYAAVERVAPDLLLFQPGLVGAVLAEDPDPRRAGHPPRTPDRVQPRYHYMLGRANLERHVREFGATLARAGVPGLATGFIEAQDRAVYEQAGLRVLSFEEIFRGLDMRDFGYDPNDTTGHFRESGSERIARALARFVAEERTRASGRARP